MSYTYFISFNGWSYILPMIYNQIFVTTQHWSNLSLWRFQLKRILFYRYFVYIHFTYNINHKVITQATNVIMHWYRLLKYWLPVTASLYLCIYIFWKVRVSILISTNDLPIVANALYLLPMFCQYFANVN